MSKQPNEPDAAALARERRYWKGEAAHYRGLFEQANAAKRKERARREALEAALERLLDLDASCDYVDGEPEECPAEAGVPCHWCQVRQALRAPADGAKEA